MQTDQLGCGPVVFVIKQKSRQYRDLENNPRIYEHVADGGRNMFSCVRMSEKHNAVYGIDDLNRGMIRGALMDASVGGCINAALRTGRAGPSSRWFAYKIKETSPDAVQGCF